MKPRVDVVLSETKKRSPFFSFAADTPVTADSPPLNPPRLNARTLAEKVGEGKLHDRAPGEPTVIAAPRDTFGQIVPTSYANREPGGVELTI